LWGEFLYLWRRGVGPKNPPAALSKTPAPEDDAPYREENPHKIFKGPIPPIGPFKGFQYCKTLKPSNFQIPQFYSIIYLPNLLSPQYQSATLSLKELHLGYTIPLISLSSCISLGV